MTRIVLRLVLAAILGGILERVASFPIQDSHEALFMIPFLQGR